MILPTDHLTKPMNIFSGFVHGTVDIALTNPGSDIVQYTVA